MLKQFLNKLKWFFLGPHGSRRAKGSLGKIFPLQIPLRLDDVEGWKPYPLFKRIIKDKYLLKAHASVLAPGYCPHPPHSHEEEEILIMLDGEADLLLPELEPGHPERRIRAKTGDLVYYPAGFPHSVEAAGNAPVTYLMFKWSGKTQQTREPMGHQHFKDIMSLPLDSKEDKLSRKRLFAGPTLFLHKLHCHLSYLPPGKGYPAHRDPYDVAIVMLDGEVETLKTRAGPFDVIFYSAGEPHGMHNPGHSAARYIVFEFHFNPHNARNKMHGPRWLLKNGIFAGNASGTIRELRDKAKKEIDLTRPKKVAIEASSACQLKCRTCPTSRGMIRDHLGTGFLSPENFKAFIRDHPFIKKIELSNWGEALLNPGLEEILRIAHENKVGITLMNGINLNSAGEKTLEALVKFKVRAITCSIDGASDETYEIYRVNGNLHKVINHIRRINFYKEKYQSPFPHIKWQFVAFGHNEHEIGKAREMAAELKMSFKLKLSWGDIFYENFSPVKDKELIRSISSSASADRMEFEEKYGKPYAGNCCMQMWLCPRINYDGRVLGCCLNFWEDFGNAFELGLETCLDSDKMQRTRDLLLGNKPSGNDIPCLKCKIFETRVKLDSYIAPGELINGYQAIEQ